MENSKIISAVKALEGIKSLNSLQMAVLDSKAHRIRLTAPTGSGKTVAFGIFLLKWLRPKPGSLTGVVIVPTRELAIQVRKVLSSLMPLRVVCLYGGHRMAEETATLSVVPDIAVATPGRLLDHINRKTISLNEVTDLVIDEYDKCLELGFQSDMKRAITKMKHIGDIMLTSATASVELPDYLDFSQAKVLDFGGDTSANTGTLDTTLIITDGKDKLKDCIALLKTLGGSKTMIFVNHRESAERVYQALIGNGLPGGLYHGGMEQALRERAIFLLESGVTPYMVTTDLGARGLDISDVGNIIHYHLPVNEEAWTHRNGRTARMGKKGEVYVLLSPEETLPEYISYDKEEKASALVSTDPLPQAPGCLYFSAGKKDKISRGDILGFLVKSGGIDSSSIGKISVMERCAYVALDSSVITKALLDKLNSLKIKNSKIRISKID